MFLEYEILNGYFRKKDLQVFMFKYAHTKNFSWTLKERKLSIKIETTVIAIPMRFTTKLTSRNVQTARSTAFRCSFFYRHLPKFHTYRELHIHIHHTQRGSISNHLSMLNQCNY